MEHILDEVMNYCLYNVSYAKRSLISRRIRDYMGEDGFTQGSGIDSFLSKAWLTYANDCKMTLTDLML
jgi:hypothetical protein